jgi:hypothetical protein
MNPWMILLIIVIALWLVSLIRAGANVRYDSPGLKVKLVIGPVSFTIFPLKKKKPKKKKPEPEKKAAPESEAQKKGAARLGRGGPRRRGAGIRLCQRGAGYALADRRA